MRPLLPMLLLLVAGSAHAADGGCADRPGEVSDLVQIAAAARGAACNALLSVEAAADARAFDADLAALDLSRVPGTIDIAGLQPVQRATLGYMLGVEAASMGNSLSKAALEKRGLVGRAVLGAFASGSGTLDFRFLRRGLARTYSCDRGFPSTLEEFKSSIWRFESSAGTVVESRPKKGPRNLIRKADGQVFVAETLNPDGSVRETEVILRGHRTDTSADFLVYDANGRLTDRSTFPTGSGDRVLEAPYTCMACHFREDTLRFDRKPAKARLAIHEPSLDVRLGIPRTLDYVDGADPTLDRPAFVRAGSGLTVSAGAVWIAQDDASFVGRLDLATGALTSVPLPPGRKGERLFDDSRGNKTRKTDIESIVDLEDGSLLLVGSGSTTVRMRMLRIWTDGRRPPEVLDTTALHEALRGRLDFAGSALNLEGAVVLQQGNRRTLRLFQRGNGGVVNGIPATDATIDLDLETVLARGTPEIPPAIPYDLGAIDGVRLTFADAALGPGGQTWFLASAEDSPNATSDGPQVGAVLGTVDEKTGEARYGRILEADGTPSTRKLEGLAWDSAARRWLAVEDGDDFRTPSALFSIIP